MNKKEIEEHRRLLIDLVREKEDEIRSFKIKLNAIKTFILDNFTNEDGYVWHEDMRLIIDIIDGK